MAVSGSFFVEHNPDPLIREVSNHLRQQDGAWMLTPEYRPFLRDPMIDKMRRIHLALGVVTGNADYLGSAQALDTSIMFVNQAFDRYEGLTESPEYRWVFAVPGRGDKDQENDEYASEVTPFLPILDPKFGVDAGIRQHTVADLAPSVIETYHGRGLGEETGAIVWTPVFIETQTPRDQWKSLLTSNRQSINDTARFARRQLRASVIGLGAVLPGFTQRGRSINEEGLEATTGHAGTVYLLNETVHGVVEQMGDDVRSIGMLGLGSIGSSTTEMLLASEAGFNLNLYDVDSSQMRKVAARPDRTERVNPTSSELELLESSDVIVVAISQTLDLDVMEEAAARRIDLSGKVIIDDSQPGCFNRNQVEARGGKLVWVVGQDVSRTKSLHRVTGYNFGDTAGLYGAGAVWGCEAEAAAIYLEDRLDLAVRSFVTPEMATSIGALCRAIDVRVATPLQSFGRPVELERGSGFALASSGL